MLCAAVEFDTRVPSLCGRAHGDAARCHPTFALAFAIFDEPSWDAISPERPLRYWRLVEISQAGSQPLTTSPLRADERIVSYLKGLNHLDDRVTGLLAPLGAGQDGIALPPSQQKVVDAIIGRWKQSGGQDRPVVQLLGPDPGSKGLIAQQTASAIGCTLWHLPVELLPTGPAEIESLSRLWQRESLLLPLALYFDAHEFEGADIAVAAVRRFIDRAGGFLFLATREPWPRLARASIAIDIRKPTAAEQRGAWETALGDADHARRLAGQFDLNLPTISQIAAQELAAGKPAAKARGKRGDERRTSSGDDVGDRLWDACRAILRPRLDALAQKIEPRAGWDDIVLPDEQLRLLQQISAQVDHRSMVHDEWGFAARTSRGLGITALFAGESGTGKTMAAEILAAELRLDLYRIDLSTVVSKYIGETERNLRRLFDAAEDAGVILFFDEADALFGKRSEVKDSHDRYANIEINYLLQRMESYRGIAILATNARAALDNAFMRRLRFLINFPYPGRAERKLIWQKIFPTEVRLAELDYDWLARLNLTGGNIQTTAINAAFLAAEAGTPVSMEHILSAARTELVKLDRPINELDFRLPRSGGAAA